ncbi:MAG: hypothetical protein HOO67_03615 [Candidatus Peribacteraceae bacterium]|nr:hypothetical protein [Candidatus Peribacteraceae bacterium]
MNNPLSIWNDHETIIIGKGPAALGPFVAAARDGLLKDFLDQQGVVIAGQNPGSGNLGKYRLNSNSPANDFLEPLDGIAKNGLGSGIRNALDTPEGKTLQRFGERNAPLPIVAAFIDRVGEAVKSLLKRKIPYCNVLPAYGNLVGIRENSCFVDFHQDQLYSGNIVLAGGARESETPDFEKISRECRKYPNISHRVLSASEAFCQKGIERLRVWIEGNPDLQVTILGGSHSAFSAAWSLLNNVVQKKSGAAFAPGSIRICHRAPVKIFYDSTVEADSFKYSYTPGDVCPQTGRVNRFGGLRGDAKKLYLQIMSNEEDRVALKHIQNPDFLIGAGESLSQSQVAILALGFGVGKRTIRNLDAKTEEWIPLQNDRQGQLEVDESCRILRADDTPLQRVFGLGLGHGIKASHLGLGEPNFDGKVDGVNVYWGAAGSMVVRQILKNRSASSRTLQSFSPQES